VDCQLVKIDRGCFTDNPMGERPEGQSEVASLEAGGNGWHGAAPGGMIFFIGCGVDGHLTFPGARRWRVVEHAKSSAMRWQDHYFLPLANHHDDRTN